MDKINFELQFRELKEHENLYDLAEISSRSIIPAEYIRRSGYEDNPDVCAIPKCPEAQDLWKMNTIPLPGYDSERARNMSKGEALEQIYDIRHVTCPLGLHLELSTVINRMLLESYKGRETRLSQMEADDGTPFSKGKQILSMRKKEGARPDGWLMTGATGCGKSVALSLCSAIYPEAILHTFEDYQYVQIPIIRVTALMGSLSDIYRSFGTRIDEILDCGSYHESLVRSASLTKAAGYVKSWIKRYHIGMMIIDEVQFIHFGSGKTSFENIVGITEETGMSFGLIGNPEVLSGISTLPRIQSRVVNGCINANAASKEDRRFFMIAARYLWKYQWCRRSFPMTDEVMKALLFESAYNIAILKALIAAVQVELVNKPDSEYSEDLVHETAGEEFRVLRELVLDGSVENDRIFAEKLDQRYKDIKDSAGNEIGAVKANILDQIEKNERDQVIQQKKEEARRALMTLYDGIYSESEISRAITNAMYKDTWLSESSSGDIARSAKAFLDKNRKK